MRRLHVVARPAPGRRASCTWRRRACCSGAIRQRPRHARRAGRCRLRQAADPANVAKLTRLVAGLAPFRRPTEWADYDRTHSYDAVEHEAKAPSSAAPRKPGAGAWPGTSAATPAPSAGIVAPHADTVVAMDADWMAIERLYQREACGSGAARHPAACRQSRGRLAEPGLARRGAKGSSPHAAPPTSRSALRWCITSSSPPTSRSRTSSTGSRASRTAVVIEFVGREDEMVQTLLANREDQYDDYTLENFRSLLSERFQLAQRAIAEGRQADDLLRRGAAEPPHGTPPGARLAPPARARVRRGYS